MSLRATPPAPSSLLATRLAPLIGHKQPRAETAAVQPGEPRPPGCPICRAAKGIKPSRQGQDDVGSAIVEVLRVGRLVATDPETSTLTPDPLHPVRHRLTVGHPTVASPTLST